MAKFATRGSDARSPAYSGEPVVLDAPAILALLYGEPNQEKIRQRIIGADVHVGAVALSEVYSTLCEAGLERPEAYEAIGPLSPTVHRFDEKLALDAGELRPATRERGLSLGDRASLALANSLEVAVLTTASGWDGLAGAEVIGS